MWIVVYFISYVSLPLATWLFYLTYSIQAVNQGFAEDVVDPFPLPDASDDVAVEVEVDDTFQANFGSASGHDPMLSSTFLLGFEIGDAENAATLHPAPVESSSVCLPTPTNLRSSLVSDAPMVASEDVNDGNAPPHSSESPVDASTTSTLQPDDVTRWDYVVQCLYFTLRMMYQLLPVVKYYWKY